MSTSQTSMLSGKTILVTGACGTVGSELVRLLLDHRDYEPAEVIGVDNDESGLFFVDQTYVSDPRAQFVVADIRDKEKIVRMMRGVDIVFHTAALKHVVLCERSPFEAVQTNIHGVRNIVQAAVEAGVERVIFTSSDKAVNPTNVMGTSKLMGERLITAANSNLRGAGPICASTRFGNVLGSNGSVVPIFHKQIAQGGPITLTDPEMTRFVMSTEEAVRLVIDSASIALGGEVFVTKMPVVRIEDLAKAMIGELAGVYGHDPKDIAIETIGTKPGEKLYEELMSDEETRRSIELERYFAVMPAFRGLYNQINYNYEGTVSTEVTNPYNSSDEPILSIAEIAAFLRDNGLLSRLADIEHAPDQRYWPGDKEES
ncbi:MAG: SDR family NAD(P)-dependent oxidoreductase [Woeseiaceae bacterium]